MLSCSYAEKVTADTPKQQTILFRNFTYGWNSCKHVPVWPQVCRMVLFREFPPSGLFTHAKIWTTFTAHHASSTRTPTNSHSMQQFTASLLTNLKRLSKINLFYNDIMPFNNTTQWLNKHCIYLQNTTNVINCFILTASVVGGFFFKSCTKRAGTKSTPVVSHSESCIRSQEHDWYQSSDLLPPTVRGCDATAALTPQFSSVWLELLWISKACSTHREHLSWFAPLAFTRGRGIEVSQRNCVLQTQWKGNFSMSQPWLIICNLGSFMVNFLFKHIFILEILNKLSFTSWALRYLDFKNRSRPINHQLCKLVSSYLTEYQGSSNAVSLSPRDIYT